MPMTPLEELRHSGSHILAAAVLRLFPEAKLDFRVSSVKINLHGDNGVSLLSNFDTKLSYLTFIQE